MCRNLQEFDSCNSKSPTFAILSRFLENKNKEISEKHILQARNTVHAFFKLPLMLYEFRNLGQYLVATEVLILFDHHTQWHIHTYFTP